MNKPERITESPFLPETNVQYAWDSTSLGWLKQCPRLYQYSMLDGWRFKGDSPNLTFGLFYHQALEMFDRLRADGGKNFDYEAALITVLHHILVITYPWASTDTAKNRPNLIRSIIWYFEEFRHDNLETVVFEDSRPAVELSFRMELDWGPSSERPYVLCGHLDRIVNFTGG